MRSFLAPALALVVLVACSTTEEKPDEPAAAPVAVAPIKVRTVVAQGAKVPTTRTWLGTLAPERVARLAADTNGVVTAVHVDRGERVSSGQLLVEVDPQIAQLQAASSDAAVALSKAQLDAALLECQRAETLSAGGALATAQLDRAKASCEAQARALDAARSQAKLAATQVTKARIYAPFSGVVAERMVQVGEFVGAASPVATVMVLNPIRVRFPVREQDLPAIQVGQELRVRVPAAGDAMVSAKVLPLPPSAREASRDVLIEASIPNGDGRLLAGLSAYVDVVLSESDGVVVPSSAVLGDDTTHRVYRVKDGVAEELLVHVSPGPDGMIAVSPGVAAGDVIVDAPAGLRDGARVE